MLRFIERFAPQFEREHLQVVSNRSFDLESRPIRHRLHANDVFASAKSLSPPQPAGRIRTRSSMSTDGDYQGDHARPINVFR